jgi:hypothetical protein
VEGSELDTIAVYFADVEVGADGGDMGGGDMVGSAPDALFWGLVLDGISGEWVGRKKRRREFIQCPLMCPSVLDRSV